MKPFKTLLVENDVAVRDELEIYLRDFPNVINVTKKTATCKELETILFNESFHITLLDIELDDGMSLNAMLNIPQRNAGAIIVLTKFESFNGKLITTLKPLDYVDKPLSPEKVKGIVKSVEEYYFNLDNPNRTLDLKTLDRGATVWIKQKDILYIDYIPGKPHGKCIYHYVSPESPLDKAVCFDSLNQQFEKLGEAFIQCNKNTIINVEQFSKHFPDEDDRENVCCIMPNGEKIKITKAFKELVFERKRSV